MNALVGGQVDYMCADVVTGGSHIEPGRIKVYAIASTVRNPAIPDVPTTVALRSGIHLAAPRPNPTRGLLQVTFSLPERAPASVSCIDLSGRVVWRNELPAGQPGVPQTLSMDPGHVIPGLYWIKVVQGPHVASKPFVIVR